MSSNTAEDRLILLRHPDLRRYLAARFLVGMATQIQTVAVGWQVFSVSGDPFDLGLVALSQFLPFIAARFRTLNQPGAQPRRAGCPGRR